VSAAARRAPETPFLRRLLAYARPYAGVLVLSIALGLGTGGARAVRAWLLKPILDDVLVPHAARTATPETPGALSALPLPESLPGPGAAAPATGPGPPSSAPSEADARAALERASERSLLRVGVLAALVVVLLPIFFYARTTLVAWILGRIHVDMQRDACARLLALPLRAHQDRRRGDLLSRLIRDVRAAHHSLAILFGEFTQAFLMLAVGVVFLFAISWQLALVTCALAPLVALAVAGFRGRIRRTARRRQEKLGDVTQRLVEMLAGIKVVKAFRAEAAEDRAFRRETEKLFARDMKAVRYRTLARSLTEMLNQALVLGILVLGAALVLRGRFGLSVGDLAAFAAIASTSYRPVKSLAKGWVELLDAGAAAERLFEMLDAGGEREDPPDAVDASGLHRGLDFEDVRFAYGREPVLRGVSFRVRAGEMIALVGRTGAGKSTLADLLLRFHDPDAGRILVDGVDLRRLRRDAWLSRVAVVSQEAFLFDTTIAENIRYGRPDADEAAVRAAARAAHVDEFAERLPEGYDTGVGAGGARLSGGQRQRVTIARALLRDPSLLVFDEATSSLDARSEALVQEAAARLLAGRTVFAIAHRFSTIRRADRILLLEAGRVAGFGTHAELWRDSALYRELVSPDGAEPTEGAAEARPRRSARASSASTSAARRAGANRLSARRRAAAPIRARLSGEARSSCQARASASGSSGTTRPVSPGRTISGRAPRAVTTAGSPVAAASSAARQVPSEPGASRVKTSRARSSSG